MSGALSTITRSTAAARFTLDGSDELERRLAGACEEIRAHVRGLLPPRKLEALFLGGGYGRGEGGVLKTDAGDQPYNDLKFYVFIRGNTWLNERRFGKPLCRLAHELALTAGVEVEFKVISRAKLRRSAASMFYYDLVMGHRRLLGDEALLAGCAHHRRAQNLPLSEATRLMMNRCSGLLFARERIERAPFTPEDADFVGRNLAKAQLALGDAVLTVFGQYHWSCRERHERLQRPLGHARVPPRRRGLRASRRRDGVQTASRSREAWLKRLSIAAQRNLGAGASDLALVGGPPAWPPLCFCPRIRGQPGEQVSLPEPVAQPFGQRKGLRPAAFFQERSRRHPRERILNALALLLWEASASNPEQAHWLGRELRRPAREVANSLDAYAGLWRQLA